MKPAAFGPRELEFLKLTARQVAVAVENVLNYGEARVAQEQVRRERDRLRLLLDVNNAVVSHLDLDQVFNASVPGDGFEGDVRGIRDRETIVGAR